VQGVIVRTNQARGKREPEETIHNTQFMQFTTVQYIHSSHVLINARTDSKNTIIEILVVIRGKKVFVRC